jgi:predicted nucleic acid-binding protein
MKFVIDTNIVFSAVLNPDSPIGQIILNGSKYFQFSSINQLKDEIDKHEDKILNISGLNKKDYHKIYGLIKSNKPFRNEKNSFTVYHGFYNHFACQRPKTRRFLRHVDHRN